MYVFVNIFNPIKRKKFLKNEISAYAVFILGTTDS